MWTLTSNHSEVWIFEFFEYQSTLSTRQAIMKNDDKKNVAANEVEFGIYDFWHFMKEVFLCFACVWLDIWPTKRPNYLQEM